MGGKGDVGRPIAKLWHGPRVHVHMLATPPQCFGTGEPPVTGIGRRMLCSPRFRTEPPFSTAGADDLLRSLQSTLAALVDLDIRHEIEQDYLGGVVRAGRGEAASQSRA